MQRSSPNDFEVIPLRLLKIVFIVVLAAGGFLLGRLSKSESVPTSAGITTEPSSAAFPAKASDDDPVVLAEPARPQAVVVAPGLLDFGTQSLMSRPTGEITLTNQGDKAVTLVAVSPTCSCLKPEFSDRVILPPRAKHTVTIAHEPRSQAGPSKATLRFVFLGNDIVNVPVEVMFTRPVKADPTWIDFRRDGDRGTLKLRSLDSRPFRVLSVQGVPIPSASAALLQEVPWDLSSYDTETCTNPAGERMPSWIVVQTDHPDAPIVDVRVRKDGCTNPDIPGDGDSRAWMILDQRVVLGELSPGEKQIYELPVALLPNRTMNERFTVAKSETPGLMTRFVDVIQKEEGNVVQVEIGVDPGCAAGVLIGTFQMESSNAGHDQQIHVFGVVQPAQQ